MSDATISLKPVNDLLTESFFVPSYQRGYRWTQRQVDDLLDDLSDFLDDCEAKESFYCLQPVVVKRRDDESWELIDGQQRLTTIFLILTYLKLFLDELGKSRFGLKFESRPESEAFLQNIDKAKRHHNIDYHHICNAYEAIETWFKSRDGSRRLELLRCLTNDDRAGRNVKVIWYQLPDTKDSVDSAEAFTRLNMGKIPLTNAELIRALFLKSDNFDDRTASLQQIKIAQEWDGIEKVLQREAVWCFLHRGIDSPPNRIEFLFQLIAREQSGIGPFEADPFQTFRFYSEKLAEQIAKADVEWLEVTNYFMTLEEWFSDRTLYHLIGYLIHDGDDPIELRKAAGSVAKSAFQRILKLRIFKRLFGSDVADHDYEEFRSTLRKRLDELEYGPDSKHIRSLLLLFNIAALLQNNASNLRFPFASYKDWDIEHVRSVESGKPNRPEDLKVWLQNACECLEETAADKDLRARTQTMLAAQQCDTTRLDQLYGDFLKRFGETGAADADNSIRNLALLDAETNRSYKNAVFPVKRKVIVRRDREGTFVPLCTKNLFLKCYSRRIDNMMFWTEDDSQEYLEAIVDTLAGFFASKGGAV